MMVGVPVLFWVWVGACWPFTWVMGVVVGVSGFWWCVFQCCVAVVCASRRVPGVCVRVSWLVPGACFGVGWLVVGACGVCACVVGASVGVSWLVCVLWWFRMLTCLASFFLLVLSFVLSLVWLITGCFGFGVVACVFVASSWLFVACLVCARVVLLCVPPLVVGLVCGVGLVVCPGGLLGCCPCVFGVCAYFVRVRVGFVFVCGEWVCLVCVVGVVVWVRGVLLLVVGCLCGLVMRLLGVV